MIRLDEHIETIDLMDIEVAELKQRADAAEAKLVRLLPLLQAAKRLSPLHQAVARIPGPVYAHCAVTLDATGQIPPEHREQLARLLWALADARAGT